MYDSINSGFLVGITKWLFWGLIIYYILFYSRQFLYFLRFLKNKEDIGYSILSFLLFIIPSFPLFLIIGFFASNRDNTAYFMYGTSFGLSLLFIALFVYKYRKLHYKTEKTPKEILNKTNIDPIEIDSTEATSIIPHKRMCSVNNYCKHCGKPITQDFVFCKYCGTKQK